jgi:hypothetical protein
MEAISSLLGLGNGAIGDGFHQNQREGDARDGQGALDQQQTFMGCRRASQGQHLQ